MIYHPYVHRDFIFHENLCRKRKGKIKFFILRDFFIYINPYIHIPPLSFQGGAIEIGKNYLIPVFEIFNNFIKILHML
ncbi:hypothetical protein DRQ18_06070 [bacterium]|nr:MAG: hypothetical protein DRQ18_06070 [bacterium]